MGRCKEGLREEVTRAFKRQRSLAPLLAAKKARPRCRAFHLFGRRLASFARRQISSTTFRCASTSASM